MEAFSSISFDEHDVIDCAESQNRHVIRKLHPIERATVAQSGLSRLPISMEKYIAGHSVALSAGFDVNVRPNVITLTNRESLNAGRFISLRLQ